MIFLEVVLTSQIAICFCGFHVIQAVYTGESTRLFKFFIGVGVFTLMLFVYCTSGQKLINKSEELHNNLYFCPWPERSESFKRAVHLCQTNTKKALVIDGTLTIPANLHTFVNSMKAVFSYLNFLLAIKDKS
uniref:Odorant receptor n=1 Tax=Graphocephala atropunctata TaxID=36148 RepID=A0A1B6KDT9_9HEMI